MVTCNTHCHDDKVEMDVIVLARALQETQMTNELRKLSVGLSAIRPMSVYFGARLLSMPFLSTNILNEIKYKSQFIIITVGGGIEAL